jgi:serine/threonine-protein kinase HipA
MARARKTQRLSVFQNASQVGTLERAVSGAISFSYTSEWLEEKGPFPISLSLPLQEARFRGGEVSSYFDNLLPDNIEIRDTIVRRVNAESSKTFDLLSAIGHDCVGALQFFTEDVDRPKLTEPKGHRLADSDIEHILKNLTFSPLGIEGTEPDFRISIAGAQEKTALLLMKGKWHRPEASTPTTHILKPPMGILHNGIDLTTSVENEWLCLEISRFLGLEVTNSKIATFGAQKCLVLERFDRHWLGSDKLLRRPQEDMCQALGVSPVKKYESDGGPSIGQIMSLLDASDERTKDRANFMRSQLVFYLLAATDGHAKNFSIYLSPSGFRMTPLYDVMSIFPAVRKRQVAWQKGKLAMAVGRSRHYRLKEIALRHFEETATQVGFPATQLAKIVEDLKARVHDRLEEKISLPKGFPEVIFDSIVEGLKKQASRL